MNKTFNEKFEEQLSKDETYNELKNKNVELMERYNELTYIRAGKFKTFYDNLDDKLKQSIEHEFEEIKQQMLVLCHEMEQYEQQVYIQLIIKEFLV